MGSRPFFARLSLYRTSERPGTICRLRFYGHHTGVAGGPDGQFHLRIADSVESPLTANIIALESREGNRSLETAIFVACDLIVISPPILAQLRKEVHRRLPDFDVNKLIVTATHTHTSPVLDTILLNYLIPKQGVTQIDDYLSFFSEQVRKPSPRPGKTDSPAASPGG